MAIIINGTRIALGMNIDFEFWDKINIKYATNAATITTTLTSLIIDTEILGNQ